jgi:hypothetical protein
MALFSILPLLNVHINVKGNGGLTGYHSENASVCHDSNIAKETAYPD